MNDKLNEFLKAKGPTEELLKKHVVENASDLVAEKILNGKKDMNGCWNYIKSEAKKQAENNCAMIADNEVFAMAIEYFNNDDIKAEQEKVAAKTVVSKSVEEETKEFLEEQTNIDKLPVTREEYETAAKVMAERSKKIVERVEAKKVKPKKTKKTKVPDNQVSIFDF